MDDKKIQSSATSRSFEELQKLLLQKEGVLLAKGRLIDNMAYQIRTLSNAIIGFSDLLLIEELAPELMEYVSEINQAGQGLSAIVNEVLDWARLESGREQIARSRCSVKELIDEIERVLSSALKSAKIKYSASVDSDVPAVILTDADHLQKCLINLSANALKNSPEGQRYALHVSAEKQNGQSFIRFDITGGKSMTPEQIEQLFEPAAQKEDANTEVLSMLNMGLTVLAGLPLTRQLAQTLGGKIEVTSGPDNSTFSLVLEADADVDDCSTPLTVLAHSKQVCMTSSQQKTGEPLVLIVEDQPSNRTVISLMLESMGIRTQTANDGFEGVEAAAANDYSLILMDLKMPGMDGYKAASEIRNRNIKTPLIALSAKVLNESENKQINSLFDGFLCKPIDSRSLARTLRQYLPEFRSKDNFVNAAADEQTVFEYGH